MNSSIPVADSVSSPATTLQLSIILPTKDRNPILFRSIENLLLSMRDIRCEILVIDNSAGPDIQLPEALRDSRIRINKNPGNRNSVFSSRNFGASIAKAELLLFLDDDILTTPESILRALEFHREQPGDALNISWEYPPDLMQQLSASFAGRFLIHYGYTSMKGWYQPKPWHENCLFESGEIASYFFLIGKEVFHRAGGYDERHLHEGTDLNITENLARSGVRMFIDSRLLIYHNESDRTDIRNWLERKRRLGEIVAHAIAIGETNHRPLHYNSIKKIIFPILWVMRKPLLFFIHALPQGWRFMDKFIFALLSGLTGAYIHHGYTSQR